MKDSEYQDIKVELVDERGKSVTKGFNSQALHQIELCGYPIEFVQESLKTEQLNHATAFYTLITTQFEY